MNVQILDSIIRIKNAALAKRRQVILPYSNANKAIGKILVKEGFLMDLKEESKDNKKTLLAKIGQINRQTSFRDVSIVSKPSLGVYSSAKDVLNMQKRRTLGISIFSTSQGIMTGKDAAKKGIGGEFLFRVS